MASACPDQQSCVPQTYPPSQRPPLGRPADKSQLPVALRMKQKKSFGLYFDVDQINDIMQAIYTQQKYHEKKDCIYV